MKQESITKQLEEIKVLLKKKDDKPLSFKEACAYLGFAPSYLYKLTYRKVIPHYKPTGKMLFFSKSELDEWIFSNANPKGTGVKIKNSKSPHPSPLPKGEGEKEQNESEEEEESEADPSILRQAQDRLAQGDETKNKDLRKKD